MNINLYCNCYKNNTNKKSEYFQQNIMLGAVNYDPELKQSLADQNYIFDDTGDNISHLNYWFGQLTGLYWVWKNTDDNIIGTNTYRIFWGDYFINNNFEKNTLYIPKIEGECNIGGNRCSIYDQYSHCHGSISLDLLYNLTLKNLISLKPYMVNNLKHQYSLHTCNMFISEREIFNKICSVFFEIIFEFFNQHKNDLPEIEKTYGQNRILDFLGERIFHILFTNSEYFFGKININSIPVTVLSK